MRNSKVLPYFVIIALILLLTSCVNKIENDSNVLEPSTINITSENKAVAIERKKDCINIQSSEAAAVDLIYLYQGTPNGYYSLEFNAIFNVVCSKIDAPFFVICSDNIEDYNREQVVTEFTCGSDINSYKRIVMADSLGNICLKIRSGFNENMFTGTIQIDSIVVRDATYDPDYKVIKSNDCSVQMIFKSTDLIDGISVNDLCELANVYSKMRQDLLEFTGGIEPYNGITSFIFTEQFPYYGLAGNPIYINQKFVHNDLKNIIISNDSKTQNLLWKNIHEMSHTYDGIPDSAIKANWNFDKEFFATLKTVYVLEKNASRQTSGHINTQYILNTLEINDTLKNRVYSSEGMVFTLITKLRNNDEFYWDHIICAIRKINDQNYVVTTDKDKFLLFWNSLNEELGGELNSLFSDKELQAISDRFMLTDNFN